MHMTVGQLKKLLSTYDDSMHVFIAGYEDGYNDATKIRLEKFRLNANKEWYYGKHEINNENYDTEGIIIS